MTGTLALVGGAAWTEGCSFDAGLLRVSGGDRVVVIPTAAAYEQPRAVVETATAWFGQLGASVEAVWALRRSDALAPGVADPVRDARFVYISGGSPMHLRSVLKDTPLWDAIVDCWHRGGVVAASGEAAAVLCTHMVDNRGGAFTVGLDLLDGITVIPRFGQWSGDKLHRTVRLAPHHVTVVGIDERTALIWEDGSWRTEGAGTVGVFVDGHRVELDAVPSPV